ncbi:nuclear protein Es2-domain-containing protein [Gamsiella multidivaricata]|uniref:nuclear protein Es2-domain-containing protein n=1 Tax=Gamsiella multidivaricata TaxID=101098 RepID=UPI002221002B|nr:nuclear protein Es2-domain-containing protein [Gamsiella multidivaricata]KAI7829002.1 nuclear protein Es2-domain-containing protein [Gamsiella multidivaricata]
MSSRDLIKTNDNAITPYTTTRTKYKSNVPPPPPQQVLEEDEYIEALSKIIERDFFPDLAKLKRQHAYLDAVDMNDIERIRATAKDITGNDTPLGKRRLRTPAATPRIQKAGLPDQSWTPARVDIGNATPTWGDDNKTSTAGLGAADTPLIETPSTTNRKRRTGDSGSDAEKDVVDTSLSLDQFQARYTSEDNASFNDIVEKINAQKREKYRWMYEQEKKSQRLIENKDDPNQKLLTQAGEVENGGVDASASNESQDEDSKLALIIATDKRSGVIPTWEYKAKNALMYYPEGLGTHLDEETIRASPKEIAHRNTGFQGRDLLMVNQAAAAKIDPTSYLKGNSTDSPKVAGYGFVSSTPTPSMSQMGDDPEMMTWGTIEDEPLLISSGVSDSGPSPFKLPPTSRRELIAQRLTEKASKSFRENSSLKAKVFASPSLSALSEYQRAVGGSTPTPRFNAPYNAVSTPGRETPGGRNSRSSARMSSPNPRARADMLSPAGKRLLDKARSSSSRGADHQLRSSYGSVTPRAVATPTPGDRHTPVTPSPLTKRQ